MAKCEDNIATAKRAIQILEGLLFWRGEIEEALERTCPTHTFDDIVDLVMQGHLSAIYLEYAFMLYTINKFPQCNQLHVMIAGGDLEEIISAQPQLEQLARDHDCDRVTINGRRGWERALQKTGAKRITSTMALEVPNGTGRQDGTEIRTETEPGSGGPEQVDDRHDDAGRLTGPMVNGVSGATDCRA